MGQSIEGRLARLKWLGDMEPEYEELFDLMNLACGVESQPSQARSSLDWAVIAKSQASVSGSFSGGSNMLATVH
jgi:hypothetical protein